MANYREENKRVALILEQAKEFLEVCGSYKPGYGESNRGGIETVEFAMVIKASMDLSRELKELRQPLNNKITRC